MIVEGYSGTNPVAGSIPTDPTFNTLKIGDTGLGDYLDVEADGTFVNKGEGRTWDDIVSSLIGRRLSTNQGTLSYNYEENSITAQPSGDISNPNDRVIFNYQYPHSGIENGTVNMHVHWEQTDTTERQFTIQYRVQGNGQEKTTAWQTKVVSSLTNNKFPYVSGTLNQITLIDNISVAGKGISAPLQFRFTRSDSNIGGIEITFVDGHVQRDMNGSREEFVK